MCKSLYPHPNDFCKWVVDIWARGLMGEMKKTKSHLRHYSSCPNVHNPNPKGGVGVWRFKKKLKKFNKIIFALNARLKKNVVRVV